MNTNATGKDAKFTIFVLRLHRLKLELLAEFIEEGLADQWKYIFLCEPPSLHVLNASVWLTSVG